jgi:GGDEF domain-containing protein
VARHLGQQRVGAGAGQARVQHLDHHVDVLDALGNRLAREVHVTGEPSTVASFMVVISLTVQRNREQRKLRDLARVAGDGNYPVRVLGAGQLLRQVDDALWRSARLQRRCTVVAVSVPNLYQPVEGAGVEADEPILVTLAARLRRLVGFRNVVGLYHPRCFVMAVSSAQDARRGAVEARDIVAQLRRPIRLLGGPLETSITPTIGVGLVHVMVTMAFGAMVGMENRQYVELTFPQLAEKTLCRLNVRPAAHPVYLRYQGKEELYVRTGNSSQALPVSKAVQYVAGRFGDERVRG